MVKTYNLLNSIWQTHATIDFCVSVFSTDMHSSSLGARPGGFLCRHISSSQCALHKHHNLNNLGSRKFGKTYIRKKRFCFLKTIWFSDPQKPEKSISVLKVFGKIDFHYAGEVHTWGMTNESFYILFFFIGTFIHVDGLTSGYYIWPRYWMKQQAGEKLMALLGIRHHLTASYHPLVFWLVDSMLTLI